MKFLKHFTKAAIFFLVLSLVVQAPAATNKFCIYKNGVLPRYESLETDINSLIEAFRYPTP